MTPVDVGVELGGTKVIVGASDGGRSLTARRRIDTTSPDVTLRLARQAIEEVAAGRTIGSIGIASFGPIDLRRERLSFGQLVHTPKAGWSGANVVQALADGFGVPHAVDTDVNGALRAEMVHGGWNAQTAAYLTVGTGVGGGLWVDGETVLGANHPEMGHVRVPRLHGDDHPGGCPYHGDCLEGMASGPALGGRFGIPAESLVGSDLEEAREIAAWYVAGGIASICAVVPVGMVIIGGGVSHMPGFHATVRSMLPEAGAGYPPVPFDEGGPEIVGPALGDDAGVLGAIELGRRARSRSATT